MLLIDEEFDPNLRPCDCIIGFCMVLRDVMALQLLCAGA